MTSLRRFMADEHQASLILFLSSLTAGLSLVILCLADSQIILACIIAFAFPIANAVFLWTYHLYGEYRDRYESLVQGLEEIEIPE